MKEKREKEVWTITACFVLRSVVTVCWLMYSLIFSSPLLQAMNMNMKYTYQYGNAYESVLNDVHLVVGISILGMSQMNYVNEHKWNVLIIHLWILVSMAQTAWFTFDILASRISSHHNDYGAQFICFSCIDSPPNCRGFSFRENSPLNGSFLVSLISKYCFVCVGVKPDWGVSSHWGQAQALSEGDW